MALWALGPVFGGSLGRAESLCGSVLAAVALFGVVGAPVGLVRVCWVLSCVLVLRGLWVRVLGAGVGLSRPGGLVSVLVEGGLWPLCPVALSSFLFMFHA